MAHEDLRNIAGQNTFPDTDPKFHQLEQLRRQDAYRRQNEVLQGLDSIGIGAMVADQTGYRFPTDTFENAWDKDQSSAYLEGRWTIGVSSPNVPLRGEWNGNVSLLAQRSKSWVIGKGRWSVEIERNEAVEISATERGHLRIRGARTHFDADLPSFGSKQLHPEQKGRVARSVEAAFKRPKVSWGLISEATLQA